MRTKTKATARALLEQLEVRQLLSSAAHLAVAKAVSSRSHASTATVVNYHTGNHVKGRRLAAERAASTAAASAFPASSAAASPATVTVTPSAVTPGLIDAVYHGDRAYTTANPVQTPPSPNPNTGLADSTLGGDNAAVGRAVNWAATHTPNYTFTNSNDSFVYGGGSGATTSAFLGADAAGTASTDTANVNDTIFDAEGYFVTPSANDTGQYFVTLGGVDDLVAVYMGGNGTPGSGTLVASNGWQGANAGLPGFSITLGSGPDTTQPTSVPIEILYANGFGGANLNGVGGSSPNTSVQIIDPNGAQVSSYQTTPTNEVAPTAPVLTAVAGNASVQLTFPKSFAANSYSVFRYVSSADPSTAVRLATGLTTTTYTDNTAQNNVSYTYYVTGDNASSSTASNTVTVSPTSAPTGPVTLATANRTAASTVQVSFTPPTFGTNYVITRSTTLGGTQTTVTPAGGTTATTFNDTNAPATSDYFYTITSVNSSGPSTPVTVFIGHGDGFAAAYYTSTTNDPNRTGTTKPLTGDDATAVLAFERVDATIGFTGNDVTPPPNTPPGFNSVQVGGNVGDDYAVRWTGYVEAPVTGFYNFSVNNVDDREQITVYDPNHLTNGQPTPVNISPANHVLTGFGDTYSVPVIGTDGQPYAFTAGQKYLVQVDYNQGYGGASVNIAWGASSTAANATATPPVLDVLASSPIPQADVVAPTPAFTTVDASGAVSKDQSYYTFTSSAGNGLVQLTFDNVSADSYNIYRATSQTGPYTKITTTAIAASANGAPLSYTDTTVTNGTTYYYILTGVSSNGETPINLTTGATSGLTTSATPVGVAPATPTGVLTGATNSSTAGVSVHIAFPSVPLTTSYIVQRAPESSAGSGTPGTFTTVTGGGALTATGSTVFFTDTDPTLSSSANYFYRAIAVSNGLQSTPSTAVEATAAGGALATEGTVEVEVRAAGQVAGTVNGIVNLGAQVGVFNAVGGAITTGTATDANSVSYNSFQFNGANSASSTFNAPADISGNSTRSIELWVDNPTIDSNEETLVSWSRRGGPDGTNMSFSYGSQYGLGLWGGGYDLQWTGNAAPGVATPSAAPVANTWHNLVFTYDGTTNDVYVDGQLYLQGVPAGALGTVAGFPVNLAAQNSASSSGFIASSIASADLASVRISAGALTQSDVTANFNAGVPGQPKAVALPAYITASAGAVYTYNATAKTLSITSGSLTFTSDEAANTATNGPPLAVSATGTGSSLVFNGTQHLAGLALHGGAKASISGTAGGTLNVAGLLTIDQGVGGGLDLGNGQLALTGGATPLSAVRSYVLAAYDNGAWDGTGGITSVSVVKADTAHKAIAYVTGANTASSGLNPVLADPTAILVRPALVGDFNLDGVVDRFDIRAFNARNAFNDGLTTHDWSDGDLTYNGVVDRFDIRAFNAGNNFNSGVSYLPGT